VLQDNLKAFLDLPNGSTRDSRARLEKYFPAAQIAKTLTGHALTKLDSDPPDRGAQTPLWRELRDPEVSWRRLRQNSIFRVLDNFLTRA